MLRRLIDLVPDPREDPMGHPFVVGGVSLFVALVGILVRLGL